MTNKPKQIGTAAETAVVRFLQAHGWPHAERRALRGTSDAGDITGTPSLCWEVKGGDAARKASDLQIATWVRETETERINAGAMVGILVVQRKGIGPGNAGRWWAILRTGTLAILRVNLCNPDPRDWDGPPVRMHLADACELLQWAGYGTPRRPETVVSVLSSTDDGVHDALVAAFSNPPPYTAPEV